MIERNCQGLDEADIPSSTTHCSTQDQIDDRRKLEEWADRLQLGVSDVEAFCRNGFDYEKIPPDNTPSRRAMLSHLKRRETAPSKWLMVSGLFPEIEFSEPERRKRLRALYKVVILLIKRSLGREAADPLKAERSVYWDPVAEVCRDLEIAQSKLSSFLKEFSGSSLTQTIDCVRAERIRKLMKRKIRAFVAEFKRRPHPASGTAARRTSPGGRGEVAPQCATLVKENGEAGSTPVPLTPNPSPSRGEGDRLPLTVNLSPKGEGIITSWDVWNALKISRRWPEFCSNSWALEFGFSSYRRMYRACVAVWKQTPHQMEMALIVECLKDGGKCEMGDDLVDEINLVEIEAEIRGVQCYSEDS